MVRHRLGVLLTSVAFVALVALVVPALEHPEQGDCAAQWRTAVGWGLGLTAVRLLTSAPGLLANDELTLTWLISYARVTEAATLHAGTTRAALRQEYLDEMERRDPEGLRRWLQSGPAADGDPFAFVRPGRPA